MKRRGFYFEDLNSLSNRNKKNLKRIMLGAAKLNDKVTLNKISELLNKLSQDDFTYFNEFLKNKSYLQNNFDKAYPGINKIIERIESLIFDSLPQDRHLAKIVEEFNKNSDEIDKYKKLAKMRNNYSEKEIYSFSSKVKSKREENIKLFKKVEQYKA